MLGNERRNLKHQHRASVALHTTNWSELSAFGGSGYCRALKKEIAMKQVDGRLKVLPSADGSHLLSSDVEDFFLTHQDRFVSGSHISGSRG